MMLVSGMISGIAPVAKIVIGVLIFCLCVAGVIRIGHSFILKENAQKRGRGKRVAGGGMNAFDPGTGLPRGISDVPPAIEFVEEHIIDNKKDQEEGIGKKIF